MLSSIPIPSSRALLHITVSIICFLGVATSRPTQNITIEVPNGTTNHGEPNMFCTPTTWSDIAEYLLFNYVAHGATVVSYPGEPAFDALLTVVVAILFPTFGVIRALNFIIRHPILTAKNDLEMAARSGALCMLVRSSSWNPQKGDNIRNALIKDPSPGNDPRLRGCNASHSDLSTNISLGPTTAALSIYTPPWLNDKTHFWSYTDTNLVEIGARVVFGSSKAPDQYKFAFVPRNTVVLGLADSTPTPSSNVPDIPLFRSLYRMIASPVSTPKLSSSRNLVKGMAGLLQSLYTSFTFYHAFGGQVNRYGFAAPGFTVLPYAVMSALNLMANLVAPHYPTLYLIRTEVMEEAERRTGWRFHHVVGKAADESDTNNIIREGWSEIAGSFKDDNKLLCFSPSAEEDEGIEICDSSHQTIYVPTCPRFRRTDDTQTSPLRHFFESRPRWLEFPRYMARRQQALNQPSSSSFSRLRSRVQSHVDALQSWVRHINTHQSRVQSHFQSRLLQSYVDALQSRVQSHVNTFQSRVQSHLQSQLPQSYVDVLQPLLDYSLSNLPLYSQRGSTNIQEQLNVYEMALIFLISCAELFIILVLSKFSGQQSTLAQRAWTVTWLIVSHGFGVMIYPFVRTVWGNKDGSDPSPMQSRFGICCFMVAYGAPAIGGFVVVSQMLKAYGICYKFV